MPFLQAAGLIAERLYQMSSFENPEASKLIDSLSKLLSRLNDTNLSIPVRFFFCIWDECTVY